MNPSPAPAVLQIHFHHLAASPALEEQIRGEVAKLEQCYDRISRCQVVIEKLGHGHLHGGQYEIRVELHVPGNQLVVRHRAPPDEDAFAAAHSTFHVVRRRLDDHLRLTRGEVKRHR